MVFVSSLSVPESESFFVGYGQDLSKLLKIVRRNSSEAYLARRKPGNVECVGEGVRDLRTSSFLWKYDRSNNFNLNFVLFCVYINDLRFQAKDGAWKVELRVQVKYYRWIRGAERSRFQLP